MEQIHDRVAGLDVHRDQVTVCVRRLGRAAACGRRRRVSRTTTGGLAALAGWLAGAGGHAGRDGGDRRVLEASLLRAGRTASRCGCATPITSRTSRAARPTCLMPSGWPTWPLTGWCGPASCRRRRSGELRELTRYRKTQIDARAAEMARLEKVLQDAGIKLTSVASKVLTLSGRAMIEALIAGERDPAQPGRAGQRPSASEDPAADRGAGGPLRRPSRHRRPARSWPTWTSSMRRSPSSTAQIAARVTEPLASAATAAG